MIRIVVDANIFISALLNPQGKPAQILKLVKLGILKLLISPEILFEIKEVLLYPKLVKRHHQTSEQIDLFIGDYIYAAQITLGESKFTVIKDDPTDNKYLECAVEGKADYIISGDHHLKDLKTFQGIKIVAPATFLQEVKY